MWLGCTRAGLIHLPINYALTGGELDFILHQCGAKALFYEPSLRETAEAASERTGVGLIGTLHGAEQVDVLQAANDPRWGAPGDPPRTIRVGTATSSSFSTQRAPPAGPRVR